MPNKKNTAAATLSPMLRRPKIPADYKPQLGMVEETKPPGKRRPGKAAGPPIKKIKAVAGVPEDASSSSSFASSSSSSSSSSFPEQVVREHVCALGCDEDIEEDSTELRYHYASSHYYKDAMASSLEQHPMLRVLDREDKEKLVAAYHGLGKEKKYSCIRDRCTTRKMRLAEFIAHEFATHQQVGTMMKDDTRPGMAAIHAKLFPGQEKKALVKTKEAETVKKFLADPSALAAATHAAAPAEFAPTAGAEEESKEEDDDVGWGLLADTLLDILTAPAAPATAAKAAPAAKKEEEPAEESDDDMGFGLFD